MDKNTIIKEIELLVKTDQNLKAYDLVKDYEGDDLEVSFWKDKLYGYIEHAFNKEKYDNFYSTLPEFDHPPENCLSMDKVYARIDLASKILEKFPTHKSLIDIGCATGENTLFFNSKGFDTMGVNLSQESIKKAEEKTKKMGLTSKFTCSNFLDLDIKEQYDVCLFMEIFEHVPDPALAVKKCMSFLKPGGLLFISTPKPNFWGVKGNDDKWLLDYSRGHLKLYSREELEELLKEDNVIFFMEDSDELYNIVCQKNK